VFVEFPDVTQRYRPGDLKEAGRRDIVNTPIPDAHRLDPLTTNPVAESSFVQLADVSASTEFTLNPDNRFTAENVPIPFHVRTLDDEILITQLLLLSAGTLFILATALARKLCGCRRAQRRCPDADEVDSDEKEAREELMEARRIGYDDMEEVSGSDAEAVGSESEEGEDGDDR